VQRVHQEDFCQALGVPPEKKYANEGGPTFADCFSLLRTTSAVPGPDLLGLLDAAIFNVIVGNADAHGKNFSILHRNTGPRLAPLYDLLSTAFYPEFAATFAMKIGRRSSLGELDAKGWKRFADDAGIGWPLVRQRVGEIGARIAATMPGVADGFAALDFDQAVVEQLATFIGNRVAPCVASVIR